MAKKLSVYKITSIAKAMEELTWFGRKNKWTKKITKQLRKRLRKGA